MIVGLTAKGEFSCQHEGCEEEIHGKLAFDGDGDVILSKSDVPPGWRVVKSPHRHFIYKVFCPDHAENPYKIGL